MADRRRNAEPPAVRLVCYGGPKIGLGHVYRCIRLARALRARRVATHLMVNPDRRVTGLLARHELRYSTAPLGRLPLPRDGQTPRVCVLDYNHFPRAALKRLRGRTVVVNLAPQALPKWYADINICSTAVIDGPRPVDANRQVVNLRGPQYAIVADEFRTARRRRFRRDVRTALVCLSGGAYASAAGTVIRAFEELADPIRVRVVLGRGAGHDDAVRLAARSSRHRVQIERDVRDMGGRMRDADLAITFPGITAYECLCVGLPTILIAPSTFHAKIARELERLGCAVNAGRLSDLGSRQLGRRIAALIADPERRAEMHRRARQVVDGRGLDRAVGVILKVLRDGRRDQGRAR